MTQAMGKQETGVIRKGLWTDSGIQNQILLVSPKVWRELVQTGVAMGSYWFMICAFVL